VLLRHLPLATVLGLVAFALAAQAGLTRAVARGEAAGAVSGVIVEDVHWVPDPGDPARAVSVTFELRNGGAARIEVEVAGRVARCRLTGLHAVCDLAPPVAIADLDRLRVRAH
jgi:hypothetical protein